MKQKDNSTIISSNYGFLQTTGTFAQQSVEIEIVYGLEGVQWSPYNGCTKKCTKPYPK